MVILTLLEPERQTPLQQWRFDSESVIRIGRSPDNQVVLEHDQISRFHVELRQVSDTQWQLVSRGTNGTFIDGNQVEQTAIADGTLFHLARRGPLLKFQLQAATATPQPVAQPQPPPSTLQVIPTNEQVQLQARLEQLTQERSQLQAQLEQATAEKTRLQATLNAIAAQFPVSSLQEQQQESVTRLAELQHTSAALQAETTFVQSLPQHAETGLVTLTKSEQKRLLDTLSLLAGDLEKQRLQTIQSQQQLVKALQALKQLEAHLKANQALANQLPTQSGTDTLIDTIQQKLKELDQELARIHELYSASQAKKIFSF